MTQEEQQILFKQMVDPNVETIGDVSDGYHTFNSLYNQRLYLWAALVKAYKDKAWKTRRHSDGKPCFDGNWFLVGITTPAGDYTYHYELKYWDLFDCKVLDKAPAFDGHTDVDVTRVLTLKPAAHPNWISVKEELPIKNGRYIFYDEILGPQVSSYYNGCTLVRSITHWMPKPAPPKREETV